MDQKISIGQVNDFIKNFKLKKNTTLLEKDTHVTNQSTSSSIIIEKSTITPPIQESTCEHTKEKEKRNEKPISLEPIQVQSSTVTENKAEDIFSQVPTSTSSTFTTLESAATAASLQKKKQQPVKAEVITNPFDDDDNSRNEALEFPQKKIEKNENISMRSIYNNFSKEFKQKTDVFQCNVLDREIEKLDQEQSEDRPLEEARMITTTAMKESQPIEVAKDDNFFASSSSRSRLESDNLEEITIESTIKITGPEIKETIIKENIRENKLVGKFCKDKLFVFGPSSRIHSQKISSDIKEYFPISYSEKLNIAKMKTLFDSVKITLERNKKNPELYIVVSLMSLLLQYNLNQGNSNLFANENNAHREALKRNLKDMITRDHPFFTTDLNNVNNTNCFSTNCKGEGISQIVSNCRDTPNMANFALFAMFNGKQQIDELILKMFHNRIFSKESYVYFLFMLKWGLVAQLVKEKMDFIFENLSLVLYLLLDNAQCIDNSNILLFVDSLIKVDSKKKTFLHHIILKLLKLDFTIDNPKLHAKYFCNFLQFPSPEKLLVSDMFNYVTFLYNPSCPPIVAQSSIMIKFKYVFSRIYEGSAEVAELGRKINENLSQFGSLAKNKDFAKIINEMFPIESKQQQETIKTQSKGAANVNETKETGGLGLTSFFASALGFTSTNNSTPTTKKEENKPLETPEPSDGVPEIFYDKVKKRYVLKGKIYDDEDTVSPQTPAAKDESTRSVIVAPPKGKAATDDKKTEPNSSVLNSSEKVDTSIPAQGNKIANPFEVKKPTVMIPPKGPKPPSKQNLANRYTAVVDFQK